MESISFLFACGGVFVDDGMSGIVSTSTSSTDLGFGGEDVGEFAFSFITPLSAEAVVKYGIGLCQFCFLSLVALCFDSELT